MEFPWSSTPGKGWATPTNQTIRWHLLLYIDNLEKNLIIFSEPGTEPTCCAKVILQVKHGVNLRGTVKKISRGGGATEKRPKNRKKPAE